MRFYRVKFTVVAADGNAIQCYTEWSAYRDTALMYDRLLRQQPNVIDISVQAKELDDL